MFAWLGKNFYHESEQRSSQEKGVFKKIKFEGGRSVTGVGEIGTPGSMK